MVSFLPGKRGDIYLVLTPHEAEQLRGLIRKRGISAEQKMLATRMDIVLLNAIQMQGKSDGGAA